MIEIWYCEKCGWIGPTYDVAYYSWDDGFSWGDDEICPDCWDEDCEVESLEWIRLDK